MRTLMWFTLGVAFSSAAAVYGTVFSWLPLAAAVFLLVAVTALCILKQKRYLRPALAALVGCLIGLIWFGGFYLVRLRPLIPLNGQEIPLLVTAAEYSEETDYGISLEGTAQLEGKTYRIRVLVYEDLSMKPGDRLEGIFRLRLTLPEEKGDSSYHAGKGIFLVASQKGDLTVDSCPEVPRQYAAAVLRQKILHILQTAFPEDTAPFAKALLLGYTKELDYETDTAFKLSGIRHVVAVSGLHVSILYSLVCMLTGKRRFLSAAAGIPVLLLFAAVAGFTPSVTRACVMVGLMMLARVLDREYDPATALSFAVLVMLLANPMAVTSVSLQLSAGCVAGILLFNGPLNGWLKGKVPNKKGILASVQSMVCSGVSVTVSAMSLVTPLSAAYFGTVSLVSLLTNLLTLWAVNLIFNGIIVLCLVHLVSSTAATLLASLLSWLIRYVLVTAKLLASFSLGAVYTESIFIIFWLLYVYLLLSAFLIRRSGKPGLYISLGTAALCVCLLLSWIMPLTADTRITMLDVGQGQAILLQSEGKSFLVDCGGDSDEKTADIVAHTLLSQGISHLDGVILTHYDRDHAGGIHHLLKRIGTDALFLPDTRNYFEPPELSGAIIYVWEDLELNYGSGKLQLFGPVYSGLDNENSVCVLFDTIKCDILITGDRSVFGERMLLRGRALPDVDILVAGHHGARNSVSEELLRAVKPETVLISAGRDNRYDHPSDVVLQRLEAFGCQVRRTDLEGTIIIRR